MVPDVALILLGGGFLAALVLGGSMLAAPERLRVVAHPNVRSFHERATPTAGGLAFVIPTATYLAWLAWHGSPPALALAAGGVVVAAVGLWDDAREVSSRLRLVVQALVAAGVAWTLLLPSQESPVAGWLMFVVAVPALVWHVNLFNFMDGIDGLAATQALVFAVGAHVVGQGLPGWPGDVLWLLAGSVLGFLVFNWPRARVFMGDVGSYFLGLVIAAVAILLDKENTLALPVSLILLAGFWFDATYTLIVRVSTGQTITQPHRTHLYQKIAAIRGHLWTTVCYLSYAALWLLPLAWLCSRHVSALTPSALFWLLPAVAPLAIAAWRLRAGFPDRGLDADAR